MRKLIYKVLLGGIILPLVLSVSNPEISDQQQKNFIQPNLGPIINSINTSQDGATTYTYKPFLTSYTNTVYGQPMMTSTQIQVKQANPSENPTNYGSIQQLNSPQIKQTIPSVPPPVPHQYNFTPIGQSNQIKQSYTPSIQSITPLQNNNPTYGQTGPTPVILQYLPQGHLPGTVQYLQLIPTRPLIVPISPYLAQIPNYQVNQKSPLSNSNARNSAANEQMPSATKTTRQVNSPLEYSTNGFGYRLLRPNNGIELINAPSNLNLNTNEFLPTYSDSSLNTIASG